MSLAIASATFAACMPYKCLSPYLHARQIRERSVEVNDEKIINQQARSASEPGLRALHPVSKVTRSSLSCMMGGVAHNGNAMQPCQASLVVPQAALLGERAAGLAGFFRTWGLGSRGAPRLHSWASVSEGGQGAQVALAQRLVQRGHHLQAQQVAQALLTLPHISR